MPLYQTIKNDGLHIGIWNITETVTDFSHLLTAEELSEACEVYHSEKRKLERCAVRALLFAMTGQHLLINYRKNKSPFLQNKAYNISISHTKGFAVIALHPTMRPGIDIEYPSKRILKVRNHVFNFLEIQQTSLGSPEEQEIKSTLYWCAKETAFKIIGDDVYNYKQTLSVQPFNYKEKNELIVHIHTEKAPTHQPLLVHYKLSPDFILTWGCL